MSESINPPYIVPLKNFPTNPFSSLYDDNNFSKYYNLANTDILHDDVHQILAKFNLGIDRVSIFKSQDYAFHAIHRDGNNPIDMTKIVWVFGPNHTMNWYKPIDGAKINFGQKPLNNSVTSYYTNYNKEDVELIYSYQVDGPVLFQAGIPHNAINYEGNRISFTIVPKMLDSDKKVSNKVLTMSDACNIFKDYI